MKSIHHLSSQGVSLPLFTKELKIKTGISNLLLLYEWYVFYSESGAVLFVSEGSHDRMKLCFYL